MWRHQRSRPLGTEPQVLMDRGMNDGREQTLAGWLMLEVGDVTAVDDETSFHFMQSREIRLIFHEE